MNYKTGINLELINGSIYLLVKPFIYKDENYVPG